MWRKSNLKDVKVTTYNLKSKYLCKKEFHSFLIGLFHSIPSPPPNLSLFIYSVHKKENEIKTLRWETKGKVETSWIHQLGCSLGHESVILFCFAYFKIRYRTEVGRWTRTEIHTCTSVVSTTQKLSASRNSIKGKGTVVSVLNWTPRHDGVLGEWMYSSKHSWPRH